MIMSGIVALVIVGLEARASTAGSTLSLLPIATFPAFEKDLEDALTPLVSVAPIPAQRHCSFTVKPCAFFVLMVVLLFGHRLPLGPEHMLFVDKVGHPNKGGEAVAKRSCLCESVTIRNFHL